MTTTPKNNITIKTFNFRTKFRKLLTDNNLDSIQKIFESFCNLGELEAINQLWKLTYDPSTVLAEHNLTEEIVSGNTELLRNELRYQYQKLFPEFLSCIMEESCRKAMDAINDPVVAYILHWHCFNSAFYLEDDETAKNRILYLLDSEDEKNYFGGIRSLKFSKEEAEFLKPFHKKIHTLLMAVYETFPPTGKTLPAKPETDTDEQAAFKPLHGLNVLEDRIPFTLFALDEDMNALTVLGGLGYDLNVVMAQKETLQEFMLAALKLEN